MKKLLSFAAILIAALMSVPTAKSDEVTFRFYDKFGETQSVALVDPIVINDNISLKFEKRVADGALDVTYYKSDSAARVFYGGMIHIVGTECKITNVSFSSPGSGSQSLVKSGVDVAFIPEGTYSAVNGNTATWTGESETVSIKNASTTNKRLGVKEITVTYAKDVETKVKDLEFTPASGAIPINTVIKIATRTEGATIYYTLDGTDPTDKSTKYTDDGILFNSSQLEVRAVGVKDGLENSDVAIANYTEKQLEQVATPVFSPTYNCQPANTPVIITCATEDAVIYYTLDGSEPTRSSIEYTSEGILINASRLDIKAIATKDGMRDSEVVSAVYYKSSDPGEAVFNFTQCATLSTPITLTDADVAIKDNDVFIDKDIAVSFDFDNAATSTVIKYYTDAEKVHLYVGKYATVIISGTNANVTIKSVTFDLAKSFTQFNLVPTPGTIEKSEDGRSYVWTGSANGMELYNNGVVSRLSKITVKYDINTSVDDVAVDNNADMPVQYYNLQGVLIQNPERGVYIRRQGSRVDKVYIK